MRALDIIVPLFNEEAVVPLFYQEVCKLSSKLKGIDWRMIFIDDGSRDKTIDKVKTLSKKDNRVRYIRLDKNHGQQAAIYTGMKYCSSDAAIVMDCDLQDPPSLIPTMVKEWCNGAKVVLPRRKSRQDRWLKQITAKLFYRILNLFLPRALDENIGEFYLLDRCAINEVVRIATLPLFLRGTVQHLSGKKVSINYERAGRVAGATGFSWKKMFRLARDAYYSQRLGGNEGPNMAIRESNLWQDKFVAVIGGGFCGLTSAFYLSLLGMKVSLYEANDHIGGLASSILIGEDKLERYYHHFFKNDTDLLSLMIDLELKDKIVFCPSRVAMLYRGKFYPFNNLKDYIKLPVMTLSAKIMMAIGTILLSRKEKYIANKTAFEVIEKSMGKSAWRNFWQPFFKGKFGVFAENIPASWFQARIKARAGSRTTKGELLGYPEGGFGIIIDALKKPIIERGGKILTGHPVDKAVERKGRYWIDGNAYDYCLSTLPPSVTSSIYESYKTGDSMYFGFVGALVQTRSSLSKYYWTNVMDSEAPFGVLVEQNNLIGNYKHHYIYLGKYIDTTQEFYKSSDKKISHIAAEFLEKIKPGYSSEIIDILITREPFAQPIVITAPTYEVGAGRGFYATSMAHIYPEDRGLNQAVRQAKKITNIIMNDEL